jgi:hypothetical protein
VSSISVRISQLHFNFGTDQSTTVQFRYGSVNYSSISVRTSQIQFNFGTDQSNTVQFRYGSVNYSSISVRISQLQFPLCMKFTAVIFLDRGAQILGVARATNFCKGLPNIFSIITAVLCLTCKDVYRFTCTEKKGPDNSELTGHSECRLSVLNLFHVTFLAHRIWRSLFDFWKIC